MIRTSLRILPVYGTCENMRNKLNTLDGRSPQLVLLILRVKTRILGKYQSSDNLISLGEIYFPIWESYKYLGRYAVNGVGTDRAITIRQQTARESFIVLQNVL